VLGNLRRALALVGEAWPEADPELRFHLRRLTGWIAPRLAPITPADALDLPHALRSLLAAPSRLSGVDALTAHVSEPSVGVVQTVLLDVDMTGEAFLARLSVTDAPADSAGGASFEAALDLARRAVFRHLVAGGPFRPELSLLQRSKFVLQGPEAVHRHRVEGGSVGAAAAVALFSSWTGQPVPPQIVVTGCLSDDGELRAVAGVEAKCAAVQRERPGASTHLLVPAGQDCIPGPNLRAPTGALHSPLQTGSPTLRVTAVDSLEQLLDEVFGTTVAGRTAVVAVEDTVRLGIELYEKAGSFALAHEVLQTALVAMGQRSTGDARFRVERFLALWRSGSSLVHLGDLRQAERQLVQARSLGAALWDAGELDPRAYLGFRGNLAVLWRDLFRFGEAEALLLENLEQQRALRQDRRELAKTLGNLGEVWTFMERWEEAERALQEALKSLRAVYPDEVPRELCYLGNLYLRRGDAELARVYYEQGLAANHGVTHTVERNEGFLRHGLARALLDLGQLEACRAQATRALALCPRTELYPGQLILRTRGMAWLRQGQTARAEADLLAAADLSLARGPLATLAAGTALAVLALSHLERGDLDRGQALARDLEQTAGELLCHLCPLPLPNDAPALTHALHQILHRFPY